MLPKAKGESVSLSRSWPRHRRRLAVAFLSIAAQPAVAGPPYLTDDPVPTDTHHWEIYTYTDNNVLHGEHEGEAGFDINYGLVKDVQVTTTITGGYANGDEHGPRLNDTEIGVKYRFINDTSAAFQASFYPTLVLPTAPHSRRVAYNLPVWLQKDFGKWSVFGGGGPTIRSGNGMRTSWDEGIALTRQVSDAISLGVEVEHSGPEEDDDRATTTFDIGGTIHLHGPLSLVASAGPTVESGTHRTGAHAYFGILTAF